jgi:ABC-type Na+ efflux pump permease subunit
MKPITIHPRREFIIWLIAFLFSNLLNAYGIIHYKTSWIELLTQLGYVFILSLLLYFLVALIRLIVDIIRKRN